MSTSAVPESNQMNFNPSWMRSASATAAAPVGKATMNRVDAPALNVVQQDYPLSDPIFVKNRYGREDLLALLPKETAYPEGLERCQFFVEIPQQPIVLTPLTDAETRLQHNINSSKAMSSLSHADRALIASGNVIGQGNVNAPPGPTGPTTQPSWTQHSGGAGVGRGGGQTARGGFASHRGRGGQTLSSGGLASGVADSSSTGRYVAARGRGTTVIGRGGSTATFNSRAQGLYDPRDPRDRPRQRVRSISDDTASPLTPSAAATAAAPASGGAGGFSAEEGGAGGTAWTQASTRGAWRQKFTANGPTAQAHGSVDSSTITRASMPEWMEEEQERGPGLVSNRSGSFDENGQFRASDPGSPKDNENSKTASIFSKLGLTKDSTKPETQVRPQVSPRVPDPIPISNPWSVIADVPENRMDIVGEQLAKQTHSQLNMLLSSAPGASLPPSDIFEAKLPEEVHPTSRPVVQPVSSAPVEDEWYYVDPRNAIQGPFPTAHMEAWFKSGYFTLDLNVRKGSNPNSRFQTLGELIRISGGATPFSPKPAEAPSIHPVHIPMPAPNRDISSSAWSGGYNESLMKAPTVEEQRQKLEEEQRRVAEKEKELKEMQETLRRQEEERLMKVREMELKLQKQQEELARRAAEEMQRAAAREREIMAERKRIAEEIERAKREEIERALAEERKREEEERIAREKEIERIKAESERLRLENEEAMRKQAEKAKEEARKKAALEEQRKKELAEKEKEARVKAAASAAAAAAAEAKKQAAALAAKIAVTEEYAPATKVKNGAPAGAQPGGGGKAWQATYRVGEEKLMAPKAMPWQSTGAGDEIWPMPVKSGKTLLEIQQEEERLLAERKQKQETTRAVQAAQHGAGVNPAWVASPQKLSWNPPAQVATRQGSSPPSHGVAWGGAGLHQETRPTLNLMFDGPSLETSNKQNKKSASSPTKPAKAGGKPMWQPTTKQDNSRQEQEAVKKLFKQPTSNDGFTNWVVQRVKQLNSQVDADVLAEFIENVDNPDEVEDYIIGYLGDSDHVKEFVREFLEKRGDARSKKRITVKDDLSGPAPAADPSLSAIGGGNASATATGGQQHAGGKKKKKSKGGRLVVDGACLGFKGTADPNRVNIGEIDTVAAPDPGRR